MSADSSYESWMASSIVKNGAYVEREKPTPMQPFVFIVLLRTLAVVQVLFSAPYLLYNHLVIIN
jgi:hypothetical protein